MSALVEGASERLRRVPMGGRWVAGCLRPWRFRSRRGDVDHAGRPVATYSEHHKCEAVDVAGALMIENVIQNSQWIRNDAIAGQAFAIYRRDRAVRLRKQSKELRADSAHETRRAEAMQQAIGWNDPNQAPSATSERPGRAGPSEALTIRFVEVDKVRTAELRPAGPMITLVACRGRARGCGWGGVGGRRRARRRWPWDESLRGNGRRRAARRLGPAETRRG